MNAVVAPEERRYLTLAASREMPRRLNLYAWKRRWGNEEEISASVYLNRKAESRRLVFVAGLKNHLPDCRICHGTDSIALWLGDTAFDITAKEAAQIEAFLPGISVERQG